VSSKCKRLDGTNLETILAKFATRGPQLSYNFLCRHKDNEYTESKNTVNTATTPKLVTALFDTGVKTTADDDWARFQRVRNSHILLRL
jgi:hypothetical protein